ncbi:hypothetical protein AAF712_016291 [Marasmius tenuissimus]|uniref:Uncharacterized protein n=1 Tax=Marasmius tenuissimus TaxID=585030 RepID=A0ABR2Z724_9AGAR
MPAYRRKMACAYAADTVPAAKPRVSKPRVKLTDEEKLDKKIQQEINKMKREKKKEWEVTLVPARVDEQFRWPAQTKGLYKSEAKSLHKLTPKKVETLRAEHIQCSPKTFVRLEDVTALAKRKAEFFQEKPWFMVNCIHTKHQDNGRRTKTNWTGTTADERLFDL